MSDDNTRPVSRVNVPRATYRIQFRPEFTLDQAAEIAPYLARLGVSHLYASSYLQSAPGSTHGYDVVDYGRVNSELGGAGALDRLVQALNASGMGQVLDMVPNHMAISPENPWWWDVLENGPSSRYAVYFDVEWNPPEARHVNQVLLPVLGDQYGRVLEAGELRLVYEEQTFLIRYFDHVYPVDPHSLGGILAAAAERIHSSQLTFIAGAYDHLPVSTATDRSNANRRYHDKEVLHDLLARLVREQPGVEGAIQAVLADVNADPDVLDAFMGRQNYRPAHWQISSRELGYRRFFDINTLIGMNMADEQVYSDTHALVLNWIRRGWLDGLRIDHPDGLLDPQLYFDRLRAGASNAWIVAEKILERGETLPETWPIDGTTGYDFLNQVNGVLIDPRGAEPLSDFYTDFSGQGGDYPALVREKKLLAAHEVLGSDLGRLTELFLQVCANQRRYRDYTRNVLHAALAETAACLPIYRTYVRPGSSSDETGSGSPPVSAADKAAVEQAIQAAKANRADLDPRLFDFLADLLLLRVRGPGTAELVERFQQFSGPVMAKGVEDTLFYSYNRFVSLNEVGGDPSHFGVSVADFHAANQRTLSHWPRTMLTTSTHDTKRGEDERARLNAIAEIPDEWREAVQRWAEINEHYGAGPYPDRNAEYLFYQNVVGAWPVDAERMLPYMQKAGREAKAHTTWVAPNAEYEDALAGFVRASMADRAFVSGVEAFVGRIRMAGWINSLAQALLKLTSPGVPDIYQGSELWNLSLVDPDNRRPVDYALRARLLDELEAGMEAQAIWSRADSGLPKLWLTRQALTLRAEHPDWFGPRGSYTPLPVRDDAGVAFLRADQVAVVVPRLAMTHRPRWGELTVDLPEGNWTHCLTGEGLAGGTVKLDQLFGKFPSALLVRGGG